MNKWSDNNNDGENKNYSKGQSSGGWGWLIWLLLGVLAVYWIFGLFNTNTAAPNQIDYSTFWNQVKAGNVTSVTFSGDKIEGNLSKPITQTLSTGQTAQVSKFFTYTPNVEDAELLALLRQNNVAINATPPQTVNWFQILLTFSPVLLFLGLGYILFRRMQGGGTEVMSMAKSRAKRYISNGQRVTFEDVAGAEGAKQEMEEVIQFLRDPSKFSRLGAKIPKGVLLVGPPGTGKTLLARAVAGEAVVPFYSISGSDFMEMFVGVGASRVRDLFQQAKDNAPAIIFIDELDSIGRKRGTGIGGGHDEREQTLNQMLSEMDGFEPNQNVIVMAATNRPDILDPALLRPGRFDRQITVDLPTYKDRIEILKVHSRNKPLAPQVNLEQVARGTVGFSGADLANLLNEAALIAARKDKNAIEYQDIDDAVDKVILGLERNLILTDEETRVLAYHEGGHAVLAAVLPAADPVLKVTIIPRGRAMGVTQQLPERERYLYPMDYMLDRMAVMMGGRASEELFIGKITSGAADDLKQATKLARRMVIEWGMSEKVGHVSLSADSQEVFLGDDFGTTREYSEATAREIDEEVRKVLEEAYERAKETLLENKEGLDRLVEALLEHEQVMGVDVIKLVGVEAKQVKKTNEDGKVEEEGQVIEPHPGTAPATAS